MNTTNIIELMNSLRNCLDKLEAQINDENAQRHLVRARSQLATAGTNPNAHTRQENLEEAAAILAGIAIDYNYDNIVDEIDEMALLD